jgi:hypothetical protein
MASYYFEISMRSDKSGLRGLLTRPYNVYIEDGSPDMRAKVAKKFWNREDVISYLKKEAVDLQNSTPFSISLNMPPEGIEKFKGEADRKGMKSREKWYQRSASLLLELSGYMNSDHQNGFQKCQAVAEYWKFKL